MRDWQEDVRKFHEKFGSAIGDKDVPIEKDVFDLRKTLIEEEHAELQDALNSGNQEYIAKEAADLIYVILGTMVAYGIDLNPVWDEVHFSNMQKVGGANRADGKVLKPAGWKAPNIRAILDSQPKYPKGVGKPQNMTFTNPINIYDDL